MLVIMPKKEQKSDETLKGHKKEYKKEYEKRQMTAGEIRISVRLPKRLAEALKKEAAIRGISFSDVVRRLLERNILS